MSGAAARTGDFKKMNNIEVNCKERIGCDENTSDKQTEGTQEIIKDYGK